MEEFAILMNGGSRDRDERATINHRPGDRTFEDRHSSRTGRSSIPFVLMNKKKKKKQGGDEY